MKLWMQGYSSVRKHCYPVLILPLWPLYCHWPAAFFALAVWRWSWCWAALACTPCVLPLGCHWASTQERCFWGSCRVGWQMCGSFPLALTWLRKDWLLRGTTPLKHVMGQWGQGVSTTLKLTLSVSDNKVTAHRLLVRRGVSAEVVSENRDTVWHRTHTGCVSAQMMLVRTGWQHRGCQ